MAIPRGRSILINGVAYDLTGTPVLTPRKIFPPRITTESSKFLDSLEEWEHEGMTNFEGGMGQKRFRDRAMYFDSFGLDVLHDEEIRLSKTIELVRDMSDLGVTLADLGGSCNMGAMCVFNELLYFGAIEGDWGSGDMGKCRLWTWDGETQSSADISCPAGGSYLAAPVAPADGQVTVNSDASFTVGRYIFIHGENAGNYEMMLITGKPGGNVLTVTRAQNITWDSGKDLATTPQTFAAGIPVFELEPTGAYLPIKGGDGVQGMVVFDQKLFVGTYVGYVFMYDGTSWYLQPPSVNTRCWQGLSAKTGSIDHQVSAMLPYKDIMYVLFANRLEKYDPVTASLSNPWSGTLHTMKDAITCNMMVLFANNVYIFSWADRGDSATMYKYDGSAVTPIYRFPNRFEVHTALIYDGKIFVSGGKYNYNRTSAIGQLYSYDGVSMRKIFTNPREEIFESLRLYTFHKMMVWDDRLYFSDNYTTGLFCYNAATDSIHRSHNISTLYGAAGNLVRGIIQYQDIYYLTISDEGLFWINVGDIYDTGDTEGDNDTCYGTFYYPYIRSSIFGGDWPNLKKLFYKIDIWHSPIVAGQKFYLHYSRNSQDSWSKYHEVVPETNSTHTEVILLEEGWDGATGGFNAVPTYEYGFEAMDLSIVLALKTNDYDQQFKVYGFSVAYVPYPEWEERVRVSIECTDRGTHSGQFEDTRWGIEKAKALWSAYIGHRPVEVDHLFGDETNPRLMLIADIMHSGRPINLDRFPNAPGYYPLEGIVTLEFVEIGEPASWE